MTTIIVTSARYEFNVKTREGEEDTLSVRFSDFVTEVPQGEDPVRHMRRIAYAKLQERQDVFPNGEWIPVGNGGCPELDYLTEEEVADLLHQAERSLYNMRLYRDLLEEG